MEQSSIIGTFNFEVNADFAKELLSQHGINATIEEINEAGDKRFVLITDDKSKERALIEIKKMNLDDAPIHKDSKGYFEGAIDWLEHMYSPAYFLGFKTPRYYSTKKNWILFTSFFLILGLIMLIGNLTVDNETLNFKSLIFILLYLFLGLSVIWRLSEKKK